MRTIVIWDDCGIGPIKFFYLMGDYRHLDRVYLNAQENQALQDELSSIVYVENTREEKVDMTETFPLPLLPDDVVIVAGVLP